MVVGEVTLRRIGNLVAFSENIHTVQINVSEDNLQSDFSQTSGLLLNNLLLTKSFRDSHRFFSHCEKAQATVGGTFGRSFIINHSSDCILLSQFSIVVESLPGRTSTLTTSDATVLPCSSFNFSSNS